MSASDMPQSPGSDSVPNNAALYESRRRQTVTGTQILDNIVAGSNCAHIEAETIAGLTL